MILFLILLIFNVPLREYCLKGVTFDIYFLGILLLLSQIFVTVFRALWNGTKHFLLFNLLIIVRVAFVYAAVLCLTKAFMIYGVLIAFVFAPFPAYLIAFYIARKLNGVSFYLNVNKSIWKKLLYLSGYVAIATTFMNLIYHLNTIMLTAMKGMEVSAQFNVALPIMQILQSAMVFPFIFLPLAVQMAKEMDYKSILFYRNLSTLLLLLVLPASYLIFWLISPWLITFLFADKYVGLANTVTLLCCGQILYTYGCFLMQIIIAMKGEKLIAILAVFCVILNVLLNLILIPVYSIPGTAMATLIAYFFFAGVSYFILSHLIKKHNQPVTAS